MTCVDRIKAICKERKTPISRLEKDLGFGNGYIGQLRKGIVPGDRLFAIAEYLNVSTEFLLSGEDVKKEPVGELVYMSANRQAAVYELFAEKMEEICESPAVVIVRAGVKKDFFPRLKNITLSRIERVDLEKVAAYLSVSQELEDILSAEDEESESIREIMSKIHLIPKDKRKLVNDWLDTIITR